MLKTYFLLLLSSRFSSTVFFSFCSTSRMPNDYKKTGIVYELCNYSMESARCVVFSGGSEGTRINCGKGEGISSHHCLATLAQTTIV